VIRRLVLIAVPVVAFLALGLAVAPRLGWATPFRVPSTLHFRGRDYIGPSCVRTLKANERPLRKVGSVFGYFTLPKAILIPHYESDLLTAQGKWRGTPAVLYVRGDCLAVYGLSGGP
jgi:hypothetical protein